METKKTTLILGVTVLTTILLSGFSAKANANTDIEKQMTSFSFESLTTFKGLDNHLKVNGGAEAKEEGKVEILCFPMPWCLIPNKQGEKS